MQIMSSLSLGKSEKTERRTLRHFLNNAAPYLFMAPAAVILVFALVYPVGYMMFASFFDWRPSQPFSDAEFAGLDNYIWLLQDAGFLESFFVTVTFAFTVVLLEMALGVGLALMLERPMKGMSVYRTIFILPMMIAPIAVGLVWRYMYNPQFGIFNKMLNAMGFENVPWLSDPSWSLFSIILADIWQWTPFVMILSLAALQSLSSSVVEAARLDGANNWNLIWHIKIPLMLPVLIVTLLLRLIDAFKVLEVIMILTNGGPGLSTEILSLRIFKTVTDSQELGLAAALSNMLLGLVLIITIVMFVFNKMRETRSSKMKAAAEKY
ncbi:sugar ABC transporter permease [Grimontia kaedaensis]|uniref:Sugar ABC transporter permease n=1 Tax=Grimontia kaedaensis TaxID=2872157 RepID=A0ABY4WYB9_9GAMM|nr:sugar ABC transporter permease [Grimontia kaedaensis]USH03983.1 sugar ABC transporter permease [Grimontia kaedaensis]